jgi:hypothetical protein
MHVGYIAMGTGAACVNSYGSITPTGSSGVDYPAYPDDFPCDGDRWGVSVSSVPSGILSSLRSAVEADYGSSGSGAGSVTYTLNMIEAALGSPAEMSVTIFAEYRITRTILPTVVTRKWTWIYGVSWHDRGGGWVDLYYDAGNYSATGGSTPADPPTLSGSYETDVVTLFNPEVTWTCDPGVYGPTLDISDVVSLAWVQSGP